MASSPVRAGLRSPTRRCAPGRASADSPRRRRSDHRGKRLKGRPLAAEGDRGFASTFQSLIRGLKNGVLFSGALMRSHEEHVLTRTYGTRGAIPCAWAHWHYVALPTGNDGTTTLCQATETAKDK